MEILHKTWQIDKSMDLFDVFWKYRFRNIFKLKLCLIFKKLFFAFIYRNIWFAILGFEYYVNLKKKNRDKQSQRVQYNFFTPWPKKIEKKKENHCVQDLDSNVFMCLDP